MDTGEVNDTLETVSIADGKSAKFLILDTLSVRGKTFILAVFEDAMDIASATGTVPSVYGFRMEERELVPLDDSQMEDLFEARRQRGNDLKPIATIQFPGDPGPVRCEEEELKSIEEPDSHMCLVALYNVTDIHDIRIALRTVNQDGAKCYTPVPEQFSSEALEISRYLYSKQRLLHNLV
jgi:hypothetical protein